MKRPQILLYEVLYLSMNWNFFAEIGYSNDDNDIHGKLIGVLGKEDHHPLKAYSHVYKLVGQYGWLKL